MPKDERKLVVPAELATHHDVLRLFKDSRLAEIMRNEMGRYPDVISCQVAVTPPFDQLGGRPGTHIDGSWSGAIPSRAEEIEPVSDHRDRGYYGQFLDYPANYDPWKMSIYKLCNHWSEWDGMREVVANAGRSFEDPEA